MEHSTPAHERAPTDAELEREQIEDIASLGIERARRYETEIDDGNAAVIAVGIIRLRTAASPQLEKFARYGHGTTDALRDEYLDVYNDPAASSEVREQINWLGTYLLGRDNRPYNQDLADELETQTKEFIFENNDIVGLGLLCILTDQAIHADAIDYDLECLEEHPRMTSADKVKIVWLRATLLDYPKEASHGA